ncbi:MAG: hypothetical protein MHMPM18_000171 [Marteilia pararefringens]
MNLQSTKSKSTVLFKFRVTKIRRNTQIWHSIMRAADLPDPKELLIEIPELKVKKTLDLKFNIDQEDYSLKPIILKMNELQESFTIQITMFGSKKLQLMYETVIFKTGNLSESKMMPLTFVSNDWIIEAKMFRKDSLDSSSTFGESESLQSQIGPGHILNIEPLSIRNKIGKYEGRKVTLNYGIEGCHLNSVIIPYDKKSGKHVVNKDKLKVEIRDSSWSDKTLLLSLKDSRECEESLLEVSLKLVDLKEKFASISDSNYQPSVKSNSVLRTFENQFWMFSFKFFHPFQYEWIPPRKSNTSSTIVPSAKVAISSPKVAEKKLGLCRSLSSSLKSDNTAMLKTVKISLLNFSATSYSRENVSNLDTKKVHFTFSHPKSADSQSRFRAKRILGCSDLIGGRFTFPFTLTKIKNFTGEELKVKIKLKDEKDHKVLDKVYNINNILETKQTLHQGMKFEEKTKYFDFEFHVKNSTNKYHEKSYSGDLSINPYTDSTTLLSLGATSSLRSGENSKKFRKVQLELFRIKLHDSSVLRDLKCKIIIDRNPSSNLHLKFKKMVKGNNELVHQTYRTDLTESLEFVLQEEETGKMVMRGELGINDLKSFSISRIFKFKNSMMSLYLFLLKLSSDKSDEIFDNIDTKALISQSKSTLISVDTPNNSNFKNHSSDKNIKIKSENTLASSEQSKFHKRANNSENIERSEMAKKSPNENQKKLKNSEANKSPVTNKSKDESGTNSSKKQTVKIKTTDKDLLGVKDPEFDNSVKKNKNDTNIVKNKELKKLEDKKTVQGRENKLKKSNTVDFSDKSLQKISIKDSEKDNQVIKERNLEKLKKIFSNDDKNSSENPETTETSEDDLTISVITIRSDAPYRIELIFTYRGGLTIFKSGIIDNKDFLTKYAYGKGNRKLSFTLESRFDIKYLKVKIIDYGIDDSGKEIGEKSFGILEKHLNRTSEAYHTLRFDSISIVFVIKSANEDDEAQLLSTDPKQIDKAKDSRKIFRDLNDKIDVHKDNADFHPPVAAIAIDSYDNKVTKPDSSLKKRPDKIFSQIHDDSLISKPDRSQFDIYSSPPKQEKGERILTKANERYAVPDSAQNSIRYASGIEIDREDQRGNKKDNDLNIKSGIILEDKRNESNELAAVEGGVDRELEAGGINKKSPSEKLSDELTLRHLAPAIPAVPSVKHFGLDFFLEAQHPGETEVRELMEDYRGDYQNKLAPITHSTSLPLENPETPQKSRNNLLSGSDAKAMRKPKTFSTTKKGFGSSVDDISIKKGAAAKTVDFSDFFKDSKKQKGSGKASAKITIESIENIKRDSIHADRLRCILKVNNKKVKSDYFNCASRSRIEGCCIKLNKIEGSLHKLRLQIVHDKEDIFKAEETITLNLDDNQTLVYELVYSNSSWRVTGNICVNESDRGGQSLRAVNSHNNTNRFESQRNEEMPTKTASPGLFDKILLKNKHSNANKVPNDSSKAQPDIPNYHRAYVSQNSDISSSRTATFSQDSQITGSELTITVNEVKCKNEKFEGKFIICEFGLKGNPVTGVAGKKRIQNGIADINCLLELEKIPKQLILKAILKRQNGKKIFKKTLAIGNSSFGSSFNENPTIFELEDENFEITMQVERKSLDDMDNNNISHKQKIQGSIIAMNPFLIPKPTEQVDYQKDTPTAQIIQRSGKDRELANQSKKELAGWPSGSSEYSGDNEMMRKDSGFDLNEYYRFSLDVHLRHLTLTDESKLEKLKKSQLSISLKILSEKGIEKKDYGKGIDTRRWLDERKLVLNEKTEFFSLNTNCKLRLQVKNCTAANSGMKFQKSETLLKEDISLKDVDLTPDLEILKIVSNDILTAELFLKMCGLTNRNLPGVAFSNNLLDNASFYSFERINSHQADKRIGPNYCYKTSQCREDDVSSSELVAVDKSKESTKSERIELSALKDSRIENTNTGDEMHPFSPGQSKSSQSKKMRSNVMPNPFIDGNDYHELGKNGFSSPKSPAGKTNGNRLTEKSKTESSKSIAAGSKKSSKSNKTGHNQHKMKKERPINTKNSNSEKEEEKSSTKGQIEKGTKRRENQAKYSGGSNDKHWSKTDFKELGNSQKVEVKVMDKTAAGRKQGFFSKILSICTCRSPDGIYD